ncbi:hypothetical protein UlMin_033613 [Ulmus minor]
MRQNSHLDSQLTVDPSFHSPNNVPYGFYGYDATKLCHDSSNLGRFNPQEFKTLPVANCQPVEKYSASVPIDHSMPGFSFLPNGVQFPVMSDQQQLILEAQARLPYLHSQQVNQHQWSNMEEANYFNTYQRYLRLQQLQNQQLESQHLVQGNGNLQNRLLSRNLRQTQFERHISNQHEQFNQEQFWNNYAMTRGSNQLTSTFSTFDLMKVLDRFGKQSYPEKILTRSNGLEILNALKFGSMGSNGHFLRNYSDNTSFKSAALKPLPQRYTSLDEIAGRIYLVAKDQLGCRFLQKKFSEGTRKEIEMIFVEIIDHVVELMTDPFGNYLIQKLLEVCDEDQHMQVLRSITRKPGELVRISCDMHGTRAVQKVIETLNTQEQFFLVVSSLKQNVVTLMKNMNGNHVAQRCLQYLMPDYSEFLFEAATVNCVELATDRHGCCVLQKCLSHSDDEHKRRLIYEISSNALLLSEDPFGNYVVQYVFELQLSWATSNILNQFEGNYGNLSTQKHSSNVVEKSLNFASEECRNHIIQELIDDPRFEQIMQDPYGNYVIQAALKHSKGTIHGLLVDAIKPYGSVLRTSPFGKKVLSSPGLKK